MSERKVDNQRDAFDSLGMDDMLMDASGAAALSFDEDSPSDAMGEGNFFAPVTSDNRGYGKSSLTLGIIDERTAGFLQTLPLGFADATKTTYDPNGFKRCKEEHAL